MNEARGDTERGRRETFLLAGFYVLAVALLMLNTWRVAHGPGWHHTATLLAALVLALLTMTRRRWARLMLVALAGLTSFAVVIGALQAAIYSIPAAAALLLFAVLIGCAAWRLRTSPHVDAFMSARAAGVHGSR